MNGRCMYVILCAKIEHGLNEQKIPFWFYILKIFKVKLRLT